MTEATEKKEVPATASELDLPQWSLFSFDACEAAGLTYNAAVKLMAEKEAVGVYGLCIVTDEAARKVNRR